MKRNKILEIHAGWLWDQGMKDEAEECYYQSENDKRCDVGKTHLIRNEKGQFIKYDIQSLI